MTTEVSAAEVRHRRLATQRLLADQLDRPADVVGLLTCYESLFYEPCKACGRVLSGEGHAPPVIRVWTDGRREARHVRCMGEP